MPTCEGGEGIEQSRELLPEVRVRALQESDNGCLVRGLRRGAAQDVLTHVSGENRVPLTTREGASQALHMCKHVHVCNFNVQGICLPLKMNSDTALHIKASKSLPKYTLLQNYLQSGTVYQRTEPKHFLTISHVFYILYNNDLQCKQ